MPPRPSPAVGASLAGARGAPSPTVRPFDGSPVTDRVPAWVEALVIRRAAGPVLLVGVATAYLSMTQLVLWLNEPANGGAGLWPAAGMSLAVLLLVPVRLWGWVLVAIAVSEIGGGLARGHELAVSIGWALGNCVEPVLGALLLRRFGNSRGALVPLSQLLRFLLLAVVVAPVVGASIGSVATVVGFGDPIWRVWPAYFIGDALGVLLVAPALLAARARTARQGMEAAALGTVSMLVAFATFAPDGWWTQSVGLLLVPCLTWAALRFGVRGTAWVSVVVTLIAVTATAVGHGPFATADNGAAHALTSLQAYLAITVACALVLAASVDDLSDRTQVQQALEHTATHDYLTGLPNRAYFATALDRALARGAARGRRVGVLLCDVDLLKSVNDTYGHEAGDLYLVELSRRLAAALGEGEEIARVGGDEFLVLVEAADPDLDAVAGRLTSAVEPPVHLTPTKQITPSLSIGAALSDTADGDTVVTCADQALYQAKKAGRGRIQHYDAQLRHQLQETRLIEEDLPDALQNGQIYCLYQPEVDLTTGELFAFESLARWQHPVRGLIPPDRFVPVAESSGHSAALFATVLDQTLNSQDAWSSRLGFRPPVSVNVSALQLRDLHVVDVVTSALARTGDGPETLWLEVTETASADPAALAVLRALHDLGVYLAIDDFGTGWSSMSRLADYPWDVIKLDRSFISKVGHDTRAEHLIRSMIVMAHALGMRTVAEGVETEEQRERLSELGCDVVQGFLFSRPVPAGEAVRLVDARGRWIGTPRPGLSSGTAAPPRVSPGVPQPRQ